MKATCRKLLFVYPIVCVSVALAQSPTDEPSIATKASTYLGVTAGFDITTIEREEPLIVVIEDRERKAFNVRINGGYFIKDGLALGGQTLYGESKRIGREISLQGIPQDVAVVTEEWRMHAGIKNVLPLDRRNRLYIYNMTLVGFGIANELNETVAENLLTRTYSKDRSIELRMAPGLIIKIMKTFTVEAGADIAGIRSSWSRTSVNGAPAARESSVSADLSVNLLRLSLGFYYYF